MSFSFVKKPVKDSMGTKASFAVWVISTILFVLQIANIQKNSLPPAWARAFIVANIAIGILAFVFVIYFVVRQSLVVKHDKGRKRPGTNPWAISTAILLIILTFIAGRSTIGKKQITTPARQIINMEPAKANYQQIIVQPTSAVSSVPVQTKVPVSFSDGSTRNCDQNAVQALRDADSAYLRAEQQKSQCSSQYAQKDMSRATSCEKSCNIQYDYQTQASQRKQCIDQCYSDYKNFTNSSGNICDTYSSSQKANLDRLIKQYCK